MGQKIELLAGSDDTSIGSIYTFISFFEKSFANFILVTSILFYGRLFLHYQIISLHPKQIFIPPFRAKIFFLLLFIICLIIHIKILENLNHSETIVS